MREGALATALSTREPETLVLLSGMLGDERLWSDVLLELGTDQPVLCVRTDSSDSVSGIAESVLAAAPERFSVAGHSFGGIVALELWRQAPGRVSRLAIISSSAAPGTTAQRAAWDSLRQAVDLSGFADASSTLAVSTLMPALRTSHLVDTVTAMAAAVGRLGLLNQLAAQASRPDSRPTLPSISVPTLVVVGADDHICPPQVQHDLAGGIPGARTTIVPEAGHMVPLEAPTAVANALRLWLGRESAPPWSGGPLLPERPYQSRESRG